MPTSADYREMADRSAQLAIASSCDSVAEALLALALNYIKLSARGANIGSQQLQDQQVPHESFGTAQQKSVAYFAYLRHVLEDRSDATTAGISGEMIRDMMVQCVERRFGSIRAPHRVQWLTDNGSIFAAHKTIEIALALNLEPCFTPVESPESNGMAEAFVKTFKRDYVRVTALPDADTALALIENWMEDYNTVHPHSRLGYRSPREYIATQSQPAACPV